MWLGSLTSSQMHSSLAKGTCGAITQATDRDYRVQKVGSPAVLGRHIPAAYDAANVLHAVADDHLLTGDNLTVVGSDGYQLNLIIRPSGNQAQWPRSLPRRSPRSSR
jgi:hypothetical protein